MGGTTGVITGVMGNNRSHNRGVIGAITEGT